jgi:hypothetical protein
MIYEMDPNRSGLYLRYQLFVAYVLDREKVTPQQMLTGPTDEVALDHRLRSMPLQ